MDGWMDGWPREGGVKQPVVTTLLPPVVPFLSTFSPESVWRLSLKEHLRALKYLLTATLAKVPEVPMGDIPSQLLAQTGQL